MGTKPCDSLYLACLAGALTLISRVTVAQSGPLWTQPAQPLTRIQILAVAVKMERWSGRVAVVTGAAGGIGSALSADLVRAGLRVVGLDRREDKLQVLCSEPAALTSRRATTP